jgi:translation initiation factor 1 (eIF-1/SUI1)
VKADKREKREITAKVTISVNNTEEKKGKKSGKHQTTKISGLETVKIKVEDLMRKIKIECSALTSMKSGIMKIQGDFGFKIGQILGKFGIPDDAIIITGAKQLIEEE